MKGVDPASPVGPAGPALPVAPIAPTLYTGMPKRQFLLKGRELEAHSTCLEVRLLEE